MANAKRWRGLIAAALALPGCAVLSESVSDTLEHRIECQGPCTVTLRYRTSDRHGALLDPNQPVADHVGRWHEHEGF